MLQFIHTDFKIDLTLMQVTFLDESQLFKDELTKEISIPFTLNLKDDLKANPHFDAHYNSTATQSIFPGKLERDGVIVDAVLSIKDVKGEFASAVITGGNNGFPNFDKKLASLPLLYKEVPDLATDALETITKGYPETNYNYIMVHTDKYDPTTEEWNGFEKIINNFDEGDFIENELEEESNIDKIRNIIQPLPNLMYVLKTAVEDGGHILTGDILDDQDYKKAFLFRDGDYYKRLATDSIPVVQKNADYQEIIYVKNTVEHVYFKKEVPITMKGDYFLFGNFFSCYHRYEGFPRQNCTDYTVKVTKISGSVSTVIYEFSAIGPSPFPAPSPYTKLHVRTLSIDQEVALDPGDILLFEKVEPRRDQVPSITPDYPEAVNLSIRPVRYRNPDNTPIISVQNHKFVDLKQCVPDMTVRELINGLKNFKNYTFDYADGIVVMNKVKRHLDRQQAKNLSEFDIAEPTRMYQEDRSFELIFANGGTGEGTKYDSIYLTKQGIFVNDYQTAPNTVSIKIEALPLPVVTRKGKTTALSFSDDPTKLQLVFYNPVADIDAPIAFKNERVLIPGIFENDYKEWLYFRMNSLAWKWDFLIKAESFKDVNILTMIYAYNNFHLFTDLERERINKHWIRVTAKTENLL